MSLDMEAPADMMWTLAEDRCDQARSKVHVLALYNDRLQAFKQDEVGFKVSPYCAFLAFSEQGVTTARGVAQGAEEEFAVVYDAGEAGGALLLYDNNGEFISRSEPNINLADPGGVWWIEEHFVVWSRTTSSLYKLSATGEFIGPYSPPEQASSRLNNLTDLAYLGLDHDGKPRLLATFSDRPPRLFAFPNSPSFSENDITSAWAMTLIPTQIGDKIAFSGAVEGASGGVIQYRPVNSGRDVPEKEDVLIYPTDPGYGNGADIVPMDDGFFILDTSEASGPGINSFNTFGIPQEPNDISGLEGVPFQLLRVRIFKDL
jgi:hypothetical protein